MKEQTNIWDFMKVLAICALIAFFIFACYGCVKLEYNGDNNYKHCIDSCPKTPLGNDFTDLNCPRVCAETTKVCDQAMGDLS